MTLGDLPQFFLLLLTEHYFGSSFRHGFFSFTFPPSILSWMFLSLHVLVILWIHHGKRLTVFQKPDFVTIHAGSKHLFLFRQCWTDAFSPFNILIPDL